jgi:hypothetical protein
MRYTVQEAAEILGLTVEAVRGRIKRGTLDHVKEDEKVYVVLDPVHDTDRSSLVCDQTRPDEGPVSDQTHVQTHDPQKAERFSEVLEDLRDQVRYLREQLNDERRRREEERHRQDLIVARLIERIPPQLEPSASSGPRQAPQTASDDPGSSGEGSPASGGAQEGDQRRPSSGWWRRFFGFE